MPVGFRIFTKRVLPEQEIIAGFQNLPAANVADVMGRSCALNGEIRLIGAQNNRNMCGPALTVKARPGSNLMIHKALDLAVEGDIIVVSNEGDRSQSLMGAIMVAFAKSKKLGGIVLDGHIRDIDEISNMGIPIYATGSTPGGPYKEGPGEINIPISCGGVSISPGDIILGDSDGVIVVPRKDSGAILEKAVSFMKNDQKKMESALDGILNHPWVDETLIENGCEVIEDFYENR